MAITIKTVHQFDVIRLSAGILAQGCDNMLQLYGHWTDTCPQIYDMGKNASQDICR